MIQEKALFDELKSVHLGEGHDTYSPAWVNSRLNVVSGDE